MSFRQGSINFPAALPPIRPDLLTPASVEPRVSAAKLVKRSILTAFGAVGGFSLVKASRWRTSRLLVLGYHGISLHDEHLWAPALFMSPDKFVQRLELIRKRGYSVIGLDEGLRRLSAGDLPPASVALTFDDGLYCFYKVALPILENMGFPATLYLTTFYSEFQEPVFDVLCSYMLWKSRPAILDLGPMTGDEAVFQLHDDDQRQAAHRTIMAFANREKLTALQKVDFGERLASRLSFDLDFVRKSRLLNLMTGEEVADASSRGVTVELHTHRHRVPLDRALFLREIEDNRQRIRSLTGRSPLHFCYPSGYHNAAFVPWLKESGVGSAATCDPGLVSANTSRMLVPRLIDVTSLGGIEFEAWLSGVASALPMRHRELPLDSRRPAGFVEPARAACREALQSPAMIAIDSKLREADPSRNLRREWLREFWTNGAFPAAAKAAIAAARSVGGELLFGAERVMLLQAAIESLDRLTEARLDLSTQALMCHQYEFFADPGKDWIQRFDPAEYSYRVYAGMSLLERFPAGRLDWETPCFSRSLILQVPRPHIPRVLRFIALELKGFKPVVFTHLAFLQTRFTTFREEDVRASYVRIARCMLLRPELKAIMTASWLYSPETHRINPHLSWTTRIFEENGAIISDLGKCPEDGGFLIGSRQRRMLYESGEYKPTLAVILWPRRAVLEWLSKQPDCAAGEI